MSWRRAMIASLLALSCATAESFAWGSKVHAGISRKAAEIVPDEMSAWRAYANLLADHGSDPDIWKDIDAAEGPRHYLDLEHYGGPQVVDSLPRSRPDDLHWRGHIVPAASGVAPWTIAEALARLSQSMADGDWSEAARLAAALGHYVGDIHQPLHCTANFDGQYTGNSGVHLRWELELPFRYWHEDMVRPDPARQLADPWSSVLAWITNSFAAHKQVLSADSRARAASGDSVESASYYQALWNDTGQLFQTQTSDAATHLASLWYTAWLDAGRPAIPPPPQTISYASIHPATVPSARKGFTYPILVGLLLASGVTILVLSIHRQRQGAY